MNRKWLVSLSLVFLMAVGNVQAFDWFDGRLSIGGGFGRAKPKLPYAYQDTYQDGDMWTANIKYFINNDFSIVASYADLEPYQRGDKADFYRFRPLVASVRYNIFHHLPFSPYMTIGAGYSWNQHQSPTAVADNWQGLALQGGVGLEFFITEGTSLGAEALYHNFVGQSGIVPYRLASLVGTVNFYFGPGPSQKRTEAALEAQKAELAKTQAEVDAEKQKLLQAQQTALDTSNKLNDTNSKLNDTNSKLNDSNNKLQQLQTQNQQAQAELDSIKQMIARKDISPITFKTASAELQASSNATLDKVADIIKKYPNLKMRIEGHTDNVGGEEYNQQLSERRANTIRDYLTQKAGVSADQITAVGMGKGGPIADNSTSEGRAQNRRVEFITYIQ